MAEEIVVRMGLDASPMDRELRKATGSLQSFGQEGHKSFVHVGSGAREFHKTLHALTEQSPILGNVLRLAISPIGGMFAVATTALTYFHEKFKEMNAEWDKFSAFAAKPIGNRTKELETAHRNLEKFNREFKKWSEGLNEQDEITENLKEQLDLLRLQSREVEKLNKGNNAELERKKLQLEFALQAQALRDVSNRKLASGDELKRLQEANQAALGRPLPNAEAANKVEEELQQELKKKLDELEGGPSKKEIAEASLRKLLHLPEDNHLTEERENQEKELAKQIQASVKRVEENNKALEKETDHRSELAEQLEEAKRKNARDAQAFKALSSSLESTRQSLTVMPSGEAGPHAALLNPAQQAIVDYKARTAQALTDYLSRSADVRNRWNKDHFLPFDVAASPMNTPMTTEQLLKAMNDRLAEIAKDGIPVFGKEE